MGVFIFVLFGVGVLTLIKNNVTYKNTTIIADAIHRYNLKVLNDDFFGGQPFGSATIDYSCIRNYDAALWDFTDWGYERLVPPDIFEKNQAIYRGGER